MHIKINKSLLNLTTTTAAVCQKITNENITDEVPDTAGDLAYNDTTELIKVCSTMQIMQVQDARWKWESNQKITVISIVSSPRIIRYITHPTAHRTSSVHTSCAGTQLENEAHARKFKPDDKFWTSTIVGCRDLCQNRKFAVTSERKAVRISKPAELGSISYETCYCKSEGHKPVHEMHHNQWIDNH